MSRIVVLAGNRYDTGKEAALTELTVCLEDYNPDEGTAYINEVMADDDANDPYLDIYQHCLQSPGTPFRA
jgi:hypothetical protein